MVTVVLVLLGLIAVGYVLFSRLRGQSVNTRRLLVLPGVLTAIGLLQVLGAAHHGFHTADVVVIAASVAVSATLGVARGATVNVFVRDGQPWLRYRRATLWLWAATVATRAALTGLAFASGAALADSGPALLLAVGATLLGEGAVVARRVVARRVVARRVVALSEPRWQAATAGARGPR